MKDKQRLEDNYPARYSLLTSEQDEILDYIAGKPRVTISDVKSLKAKYKVTAKPIQRLLDALDIVIYPDPPKQSKPKIAPKPAPTPTVAEKFCGTEDTTSKEIERLKAQLRRKEEQLDLAKASVDAEIALLRKEREETKKQMRDTAILRRSTATERKESYELKQRNEKLIKANRELRRRLDPNSTEWVGELGSYHGINQTRKIDILTKENEKLTGRLAAFQAPDAKHMNVYFAQYLPFEMLEPLLTAIYFEIERRKKGGRIKHGV